MPLVPGGGRGAWWGPLLPGVVTGVPRGPGAGCGTPDWALRRKDLRREPVFRRWITGRVPYAARGYGEKNHRCSGVPGVAGPGAVVRLSSLTTAPGTQI